MLPSASAVNPCGPDSGVGSAYSLIAPVCVSTRPRRFENWPVYHMPPSGVASGSCGRDLSVGTAHSLNVTFAGPSINTAGGRGFSGKFVARYVVTLSATSGGSATIVEMSARHASFVYPPEFTIMLSEWQFAQTFCTWSLPAPSGRFTGGPPRPPRPWAESASDARSAPAMEKRGSNGFFMLAPFRFRANHRRATATGQKTNRRTGEREISPVIF